MQFIHLPVLPIAFHVSWHLGSRSEVPAAGTRIMRRNRSFPLGGRNHGAKPWGGKGPKNRDLTPAETRQRTTNPLTLGRLDGVLFSFLDSGALIYSCDVQQG